jgi:hypothetical protein
VGQAVALRRATWRRLQRRCYAVRDARHPRRHRTERIERTCQRYPAVAVGDIGTIGTIVVVDRNRRIGVMRAQGAA